VRPRRPCASERRTGPTQGRALLLDRGQHLGMGFEVAVELFEDVERLGAHVVLHALDIVVNDLLGEAEQGEEIGQQCVAVGDAGGDLFAGAGEDHTAVFLVFYETLAVEALDHGGDAGLGDLKLGGDVHDAGVALRLDQLADALEVVLHCGGRARGCGLFGHEERAASRPDGRISASWRWPGAGP